MAAGEGVFAATMSTLAPCQWHLAVLKHHHPNPNSGDLLAHATSVYIPCIGKWSRYSLIAKAAVAPSPAAVAICSVAPERTSPEANTPLTLVCKCPSVLIKPRSSRATPL